MRSLGYRSAKSLANIDSIVFVHGLGSNPDTTWRARRPASSPATNQDVPGENDSYVTWVRDFLPDDLPPSIREEVRMFFYNYDSYWKRDALDNRLTNLGSALLERIGGGIRKSDAVSNKGDLIMRRS